MKLLNFFLIILIAIQQARHDQRIRQLEEDSWDKEIKY